jgi:serine/threonine protein kinase
VDEPEWADVSDEAKDLVSKLLNYNPAERISAMDALQHPWLKKMVNVEKVKTEVAKRTLSNLRNFRVSKINNFNFVFIGDLIMGRCLLNGLTVKHNVS